MKSYVVIGLGRFGAELATRLYACGEEVMAIDTNGQLVDKIADRVTRAVAADARDIDVLEKLGVENFDRAVGAVGSDLASSSLITRSFVLPRAGSRLNSFISQSSSYPVTPRLNRYSPP